MSSSTVDNMSLSSSDYDAIAEYLKVLGPFILASTEPSEEKKCVHFKGSSHNMNGPR